MGCSLRMMKLTGSLHVIALMVTMFGTYKQIESINAGEPASLALSLSLMMMMLLRVPNQICVALESSHGWLSVVGSILGAMAFGILTYYNYKAIKLHSQNKNKNAEIHS